MDEREGKMKGANRGKMGLSEPSRFAAAQGGKWRMEGTKDRG